MKNRIRNSENRIRNSDRELMQQALDALEYPGPSWPDARQKIAEALRARLAQPEQEPVACPYCHYSHTLGAVFFDQNCAGCVNRMTTPPQRGWQGLTDEEITETLKRFGLGERAALARAIEAKLKEKNT